LFCEYIPLRLSDWLAAGDLRAADPASPFASVDAQLTAGVEFMTARGFIHFDVHFHNVLTDTERCYFADFGLATSDRFDLTGAAADVPLRMGRRGRCAFTAGQRADQPLCSARAAHHGLPLQAARRPQDRALPGLTRG